MITCFYHRLVQALRWHWEQWAREKDSPIKSKGLLHADWPVCWRLLSPLPRAQYETSTHSLDTSLLHGHFLESSRNAPPHWGGALRDDTKNDCVAEYLDTGQK